MKRLYNFTLLLLAVVFLVACSRKKNTFLNRNMVAVSTEYNILFNGEEAFEEGKKQLALDFKDNFWEILPVERISIVQDETKAPGASQTTGFNRAEEKAAKAIQKNSMYIDGAEYNPQIDEAYMLLGKARYYDGRFIPALDAFNFILDRFPASNSINQAKVWKAKTSIRLNNEEYAIENLKRMFREEELEEEEIADGAAMMAQAYINLDSLSQALEYMNLAVENTKDNELKGRYTFIQGQLYDRLDQIDSANVVFDRVIEMNRKTSRSYLINAHIEKAKNFDYEKGDRLLLRELLEDLAQNRENRPYLDRIYNQTGVYYQNTDSLDAAVAFYNESIKEFRQDRVLQSVNYNTLAEINFDNAEYRNAGAYYDSTLIFLEERSREWRRVKKKRENLDDVIKYEDIAFRHDSILELTRMTPAAQLAFFTEHTSKLREKAVQDSLEAAKNERRTANNEFYKKEKNASASAKGNSFYFYNPATVAYGKGEFKKIWGDRRMEDNWRLSTKTTSLSALEDEIVADAGPISQNQLFEPETYIAQIPTDEKVIDSLTKDRNFAYYQLGVIYKEKFREFELAVDRLEKLLTYNPEERIIVPAKYNLHKLYEILGRENDAEKYKIDIINNYPNTRYAEILLNPNSQLPTDESSPEYKYKQLYKEFLASKYDDVIQKSDEYITLYHGTPIVPKFELLKATALAKEEGFEAYKKALNFVALNYPNSDEGKQAQHIYDNVLPALASTDFTAGNSSESWKLVYTFTIDETEEAQKLQTLLNKAITELEFATLETSIDYYDPQTRLVIVHGLNSKLGTEGFGEVLKERKGYKIMRPFFEISTPNYTLVQIHKNLDKYLEQEQTP